MDQEEEKVKRRRVRKKIVEIDTIEKLNLPNNEKKPMTLNVMNDDESYNNSYKKEDINQSQISFGKFNITVKKASSMTPEELRKYYDEKFKINESDKTSKLMVQNDDNIVYTPIMENETLDKSTKKTDKKTESIKTSKKTEKKNKTLAKFIDSIKEEWPDQTDILCWWCCHNFDSNPVPCPNLYDNVNDKYKVNGIFCSWSCAAAYSIEQYTDITLLQQLKNDLDTNSVETAINIAPSRYVLKNFGGYMSIKDFRNLSSNKKILISTEKISYINQDIIEMS